MKTQLRRMSVGWLLGLLGLAGPVWGAGTPAGTAITHSVMVTYKDMNGSPMPIIHSNVLTTIVAQVAAVDISPETSREQVAAAGAVAFAIDVTNVGNGPDEIRLRQAGGGGGWETAIYGDANGNGILDAAEEETGNQVSEVSMAADESVRLLLVLRAPAEASDGSETTIEVTATSSFDEEVSDMGSYTAVVSRAVIRIAMTATPPYLPPGDAITYAIRVQNRGAEPAADMEIVDPLPPGLTYLPGSLRFSADPGTQYDGATDLSDTRDGDEGDFGESASNAVTVRLDALAPGEDRVVFFQARTDQGLPSGTQIANAATAGFEGPGGTTETAESAPAIVEIAPVAGPLLEAPVVAGSGQPADTLWFPLTIINGGNIADLLQIEAPSDRGFEGVLWLDANNDGIAGSEGDFPLTDTDGNGAVDTRLLASGEAAHALLGIVIPSGTMDGEEATTTVNVISTEDPAATAQVAIRVAVQGPNLSVDRSVFPEGSQPPGQTLIYTVVVTNNGQGTATETMVRNSIPQYTTYVPNSVTVNDRLRTDENDGDEVTVKNREVVVRLGALGPGGSGTVIFRVKID